MFTATKARFLPNASTQNRPPDFQTPPYPAIGATKASFAFLAARVVIHQIFEVDIDVCHSFNNKTLLLL
jgi:hypothetical protein